MNPKGRFLFVLGAHRSGTSLTAAACDALGANLGERFIESSDENPKGFFEDGDVVALNDRLLRSVDLSWDSIGYTWEEDFSAARFQPYRQAAVDLLRQRFAGSGLAALKDPRLCILLPFWRSVVAEALDVDILYLVTVRNPVHCAQSQRVRAVQDGDFHLLGRQREHTLLLWIIYYHHVMRSIDPASTLFLSYDALVAKPAAVLQQLAEFIGVDALPQRATDFCSGFVDPALDRSAVEPPAWSRKNPDLWRWSDELYRQFLALTDAADRDAGQIEGLRLGLDPARETELFQRETQHMYGRAYKKVLSLRHRLIRCIGELGQEMRRVAELEQRTVELEEQHARQLQAYSDLDARFQEILDSRAWRAIVAFRRYRAMLGRPFRSKTRGSG